MLKFFLKKVEAYQVITDRVRGTTTTYKLEVTEDISSGSYYIYKTGTNSGAQIYNDTTGSASIRVEALRCAYFDADPTYGTCFMAWNFIYVGV